MWVEVRRVLGSEWEEGGDVVGSFVESEVVCCWAVGELRKLCVTRRSTS